MTRSSADIVKVHWNGSGAASPITLGTAVDGFKAFSAAQDGERVSYSIEHQTSSERESGRGVYTHSGTTLTRERVTASTNSDALVNFSSGSKHVRLTVLAEDIYENRAATDPTTEGRSQGYIAGRSRWLNTNTEKLWICLNDDDESSPSNVVWGQVATADEIAELSLADGSVTNAKLADMADGTFMMRALGAGTGVPIHGTATQAKTALSITPTDISGLTDPASDEYATTAEARTGTSSILVMSPANTRAQGSTYLYVNGTAAGGNITEITAAHAGQSIDFDQALTLDEAFGAGLSAGVGLWVELINVHATNNLTITVEAGAGGTGTINGVGTYTVPAGGGVILTSISNAGDQPLCRASGDTAEVDFNQRVVTGNRTEQNTINGNLTVTTFHTGQTILYTGAGHTFTFTSAGLTAGSHGVIRNRGTGVITVATDLTEKFKGTEPIPINASATWEVDGTNLWLDVNV